MRITLNGSVIDTDGTRISDICHNDVTILNGFTVPMDTEIKEGDVVFAFDKDHVPTGEEYRMLLSARNPHQLKDILSQSTIGIAGLGGLGSNVAQMLVRTGIGKLVIADHDIVDATNLNRQNYFTDDLGHYKTEACRRILGMISPYTSIEGHTVVLNEDNIPDIFGECDIIIECFDSAENKAMLINTVLEKMDIPIISGSGMAGYGDPNSIRTERRFNRLYICGDGTSEASADMSLMAPRVMICAGHMADTVLTILSKGGSNGRPSDNRQ